MFDNGIIKKLALLFKLFDVVLCLCIYDNRFENVTFTRYADRFNSAVDDGEVIQVCWVS